jgi:apolipoprotein N-acyltransferase
MINIFNRIATRFPLLSRFILGVGTALALPPVSLLLSAVLCLTLLILLESAPTQRNQRTAFIRGLAFGFGYFCFALHWIGFAFFVDVQNDLWMMPFAVGGLSLFMAVFWGVAFVICDFIVKRGFLRWLILPCSLAFIEWLRGYVFTGFPWAVPGLMAEHSSSILQLASVFAMPGLTLLVLVWCMLPGALLLSYRGGLKQMSVPLVLLLTLPVSLFWGQQRLAHHPMTTEGPLIRLVQPNIAQSDKWRAENASKIFDELMTLTTAESETAERPVAVIWPEASVPFLLDESETALKRIAEQLESGQTLLAGSIRRTVSSSTCIKCPDNYFTSILSIDDGGRVIGRYDKWRLVPGGEYLPLAWLLEPLGFRKVVNLPESFSAGPGPTLETVPGVGAAVMLICYEAIFPHQLVPDGKRGRWIVNVTNDGWFGRSIGPYQHLAQVRMRAVEQGLPVARAANTGISAVMDGLGRTVAATALGEQGFVDARLPPPLGPTLFARYGILPSFIIFAALLAIAGFARRSSEKPRLFQ